MFAFGDTLRSLRQPRRAAVAAAAGLAAVALPLMGATSAHAATNDVAPVGQAPITENFGVPGPWAAGYHTGVDFGVPVGTPVHSVADGTVAHSGWAGAYGNDIVVKLSDGKYALYAHLSKIDVHAGQKVTAGQEIGLSGATGNVTGPHLHFEIRNADVYAQVVNPITYLKAHGADL